MAESVIDAAAEVVSSLAKAGGSSLPTHRQCTITITNECEDFILCNPRTYIESGSCTIPLPPYIATSGIGEAQFSKTPVGACGSVGVFTFDLQKEGTETPTEKIAVMFSVPFDFNLYSNWYAVGCFDNSVKCDYSLYNEMYNNKPDPEKFVRGKAKDHTLIFKGANVQIMATMSDCHQPIIKMHVMKRAKKRQSYRWFWCHHKGCQSNTLIWKK